MSDQINLPQSNFLLLCSRLPGLCRFIRPFVQESTPPVREGDLAFNILLFNQFYIFIFNNIPPIVPRNVSNHLAQNRKILHFSRIPASETNSQNSKYT